MVEWKTGHAYDSGLGNDYNFRLNCISVCVCGGVKVQILKLTSMARLEKGNIKLPLKSIEIF